MSKTSIRVEKGFSDQELVMAITSNKDLDKALDFIYRNYYKMLETIILNNSGSQEDAQDIVQEALLAFLDMVRKGKYRSEASVKSMLYTLTRNLWLTELRRRGSAQKRDFYFEGEKDSIEKDITDQMAYYEGLKLVAEVFDRLGEICKNILTLFYFEGFSMKEILEKVDYENEQVLRNKKYKCQKELMRQLEASPTLYNNLKSALEHGR